MTAAKLLFAIISGGDRTSKVIDMPSHFIPTVACLPELAPYITGSAPELGGVLPPAQEHSTEDRYCVLLHTYVPQPKDNA